MSDDARAAAELRLWARYGRNGTIGHHGDCNIYAADCPFCDCGLLHDLVPLSEPQRLYPRYSEDEAMHHAAASLRAENARLRERLKWAIGTLEVLDEIAADPDDPGTAIPAFIAECRAALSPPAATTTRDGSNDA